MFWFIIIILLIKLAAYQTLFEPVLIYFSYFSIRYLTSSLMWFTVYRFFTGRFHTKFPEYISNKLLDLLRAKFLGKFLARVRIFAHIYWYFLLINNFSDYVTSDCIIERNHKRRKRNVCCTMQNTVPFSFFFQLPAHSTKEESATRWRDIVRILFSYLDIGWRRITADVKIRK